MDTRSCMLLFAVLLAGTNGEVPAPTPVPALSSFVMQSLGAVLKEVPGAECRRELAVVFQGLQNFTDWALQMADATAKVPSGLLRGNLHMLGDVDECEAVDAPDAALPIRGKYCLVSVHLDTDNAAVARLLDIATGGRRHLEFRHRRGDAGDGVIRQSLEGVVPEVSRAEWAVCVPAACSPADVEAAVVGAARRALAGTSLRLDIHVPELACQTRHRARPLGASHYAFAFVIGIFIIFSIIGSVWDSYCDDKTEDESSSWRLVLRAFSLRSGWKGLTSERQEELGCISGLRATSSIFMVFVHEAMYTAQEPSINKTKFVHASTTIYYTPIVTGSIIVESFFTMSGILYSYFVANSVINGSFSYVMTLVFRFIRISPVYFLSVWFYATFLEYLGEGPNWSKYINYNVETCRENWFWNILYVNNYVNTLTLCVPPSWFLASDMQMVALAPLAVIPLFRWRRGRQLMLALIALSVVVTAATVVILRIPGIYRVLDTDLQVVHYFLNNHLRTHMHASSYLVGLYVGYILHKFKNKKIVLSKSFLVMGWAISLLIFAANCLGPIYMLQENYKYNPLDSAAYPAVGRLLWAVGVSWMIFTCHTGYGGLLNKFFNCYALRVISRLTYLINLSHFIFLLHNKSRRRIPIWIDDFTWIQTLIADYMMAMAISVILYLVVDSPINLLTRSFLFRGISKKINGPPPVSNDIKNK